MRTTIGIGFALVIMVIGVVVILRDPESWEQPTPVRAAWKAPGPTPVEVEPVASRHARQAAPEQVPTRHARMDETRRPRDSETVSALRQAMRETLIAWEDHSHLSADQRQAVHDVLADMADEYRDAQHVWDAERATHPHDAFVADGAGRADLAIDLAPELYSRLAEIVGKDAADDFESYNGAFVSLILRYDVVSRD